MRIAHVSNRDRLKLLLIASEEFTLFKARRISTNSYRSRFILADLELFARIKILLNRDLLLPSVSIQSNGRKKKKKFACNCELSALTIARQKKDHRTFTLYNSNK